MKMKTNKGMALTFLGDGGICIRCDWFKNGQNQLIAGRDYTPELLYRVIENLRKIRDKKKVKDIYQDKADAKI